MLKYGVATSLDYCLEDAAFNSKWQDGKFTASERRVLMTEWVGEAWEQICSDRYIHRYFQKTGCLLGTTQPSFNKINIQGLKDYVFTPPTKFVINLDSDPENTDSSSEDSKDFDSEFSSGDYLSLSEAECSSDGQIPDYTEERDRRFD
jgi:hypothetical protein